MARQTLVLEIGEAFPVPVGNVDDDPARLPRLPDQSENVGNYRLRLRIGILAFGMQKRVLHVDHDKGGLCHASAFLLVLRQPARHSASRTMR